MSRRILAPSVVCTFSRTHAFLVTPTSIKEWAGYCTSCRMRMISRRADVERRTGRSPKPAELVAWLWSHVTCAWCVNRPAAGPDEQHDPICKPCKRLSSTPAGRVVAHLAPAQGAA
jgi:hypothetical protein